MMKVYNRTEVRRVDPVTGEVSERETTRTWTSRGGEHFVRLYPSVALALAGRLTRSEARVLLCLASMMAWESSEVVVDAVGRRALCESAAMDPQLLSRALRGLEAHGALRRVGRGRVALDPRLAWCGTEAGRREAVGSWSAGCRGVREGRGSTA